MSAPIDPQRLAVHDRVRLVGAGQQVGVVTRISRPLGVTWYRVDWPCGEHGDFRGHSLIEASS